MKQECFVALFIYDKEKRLGK